MRAYGTQRLNRNNIASVRECSNSAREFSNGDRNSILDCFERFCLVDLQLSKDTVKRHHAKEVNRFLEWLRKAPSDVSDSDVREYLMKFTDRPYTYKNILSALRRFFRDYLRRPEIIDSFRFPSQPLSPKPIPTREELTRFYDHLLTLKQKVAFLLLASTGIRISELLSLHRSSIDFEKRMLMPHNHTGSTKRVWVSFFNQEASNALKEYSINRMDTNDTLVPFAKNNLQGAFAKASVKSGVKITAQTLREWFCQTMGELSVPDRFIDAFCGRTPKSVLARHYSDYSPERLKRIYDQAGLKVLS